MSSAQSPISAPADAHRFTQAIREQFPALARRHQGVPVAYFDGPGGTQTPSRVVDAMRDYLLHHNANTHWRYPTSAETDVALAAARAALADFLHCAPDEVAFGANMSTLTFHVSRALARQWTAGDEIVVTELDHHANVDPWRHAARDRGLTVRAVRIDPQTQELDWDHFASLVGPRTKLVAIGAASNALGTVNDVARAVRLAHAAGALAFVDAVHYAPHSLVDVQALECDLLACSAYKFYGPHVGVLFGRRQLLGALDVPKLEPAPETAPERVETGTQNHEGIVGAAAAVDFLASIDSTFHADPRADRLRQGYGGPPKLHATADAGGLQREPGEPGDRRAALAGAFDALHAQGEALVTRLWNGLEAIPGVRLYGRRPGLPRTPTVGFVVNGRDAGDVAAALAERALFVSHGDFYASTAVERLAPGPGGLVRAGCACYTTEDEIDRLIGGVRLIASR
jgi:cysteine desulfurase family protein (TIGR01976 family)